MKVTVCQLPDEADAFKLAWPKFVAHADKHKPELVLLPEMPFCPWFAAKPTFDAKIWNDAIQAHEDVIGKLKQLSPATVFATMPANLGEKRLNLGFAWDNGGFRILHQKFYLPNEAPVWEYNWYQRGDGRFDLAEIKGCKIGYLICTELWFMEQARRYGKQGAQIILSPRKTGDDTLEQWLAAGKVAAITSGAFSLSSNSTSAAGGNGFGGMGWIIHPSGKVLGTTSRENPFLTLDIDLKEATEAKNKYPRNVPD